MKGLGGPGRGDIRSYLMTKPSTEKITPSGTICSLPTGTPFEGGEEPASHLDEERESMLRPVKEEEDTSGAAGPTKFIMKTPKKLFNNKPLVLPSTGKKRKERESDDVVITPMKKTKSMTKSPSEDDNTAAWEYERRYEEAYILLYSHQESMKALPAVVQTKRRGQMFDKVWSSPRQVVLDRKKKEHKYQEPAKGVRMIQQMFGGGVNTPQVRSKYSPLKKCVKSRQGRCLTHRCPYQKVKMMQNTMMKAEDGKLMMKTLEVEKEVCSEIYKKETQNVQNVVSGGNGGADFGERLGVGGVRMKDNNPENPATEADSTQD